MLSSKLIVIGVLGIVAVLLFLLYRRPERRAPRLGRPLQGRDGDASDTASMVITPAMLASDGSQESAHHSSPSHHSPHHGSGDGDGGN